jgi:hypothetical protein
MPISFFWEVRAQASKEHSANDASVFLGTCVGNGWINGVLLRYLLVATFLIHCAGH